MAMLLLNLQCIKETYWLNNHIPHTYGRVRLAPPPAPPSIVVEKSFGFSTTFNNLQVNLFLFKYKILGVNWAQIY